MAGAKPRRVRPAYQTLDEAEKTHIAGALEACRGNVTAAADVLAIDRKTLYRKMRRFGLAVTRSAGVREVEA